MTQTISLADWSSVAQYAGTTMTAYQDGYLASVSTPGQTPLSNSATITSTATLSRRTNSLSLKFQVVLDQILVNEIAQNGNKLTKQKFQDAVIAAAAALGVNLTVTPKVNLISQVSVNGLLYSQDSYGDTSSGLSSGAIIGIIVGVGIVLIILFVLVWYFAFNTGIKAKKASGKAEFDDITVDASASAVTAPSAVSGQISGDADLEVKLDVHGAETAVTSVEMATVETEVDASAVVSVEMQSTVTMEVEGSAVINGADVEVEVEATAVRTQV